MNRRVEALEGPSEVPRLHKVPWLAKLLGISEKQTYEAIAAQQVPPDVILRVGKRIRIIERRAVEWILGDSGGHGATC